MSIQLYNKCLDSEVMKQVRPSLCPFCLFLCYFNHEGTDDILQPHLNLINIWGNVLKCFSHFWLHTLQVPLLFPLPSLKDTGWVGLPTCSPQMWIWTFSGFPCLFSTLSGCFVLFSDIWQAHVASWIQTLPCSRLESFVTIWHNLHF